MSNLVQKFEKKQIDKLTSKKNIPTFRPGDTLRVIVKIIEGECSRLQAFEGICIARKNNLLNSKFTVRKLSHGEGVERVFPLISPLIDKIEVVRKGDVRRAKLYYLRNRKGKSARIVDSNRGEEADQYELKQTSVTEKKTTEHNEEAISENINKNDISHDDEKLKTKEKKEDESVSSAENVIEKNNQHESKKEIVDEKITEPSSKEDNSDNSCKNSIS